MLFGLKLTAPVSLRAGAFLYYLSTSSLFPSPYPFAFTVCALAYS